MSVFLQHKSDKKKMLQLCSRAPKQRSDNRDCAERSLTPKQQLKVAREWRKERAEERRLNRNRDKQKTPKSKNLELETTVMESRSQDRHKEIHPRNRGTCRSVVRELGVPKTALFAGRRDAKQAREGKITPGHPSPERRNSQD